MRPGARHLGLFARIFIGFTAWAVFFVLIYGMQAVGCRLAWDRIEIGAFSLQRLQQIAFYIAGLLAMLGLFAWVRRSNVLAKQKSLGEFMQGVSLYATAAAGIALAFCFTGVLWLTAC